MNPMTHEIREFDSVEKAQKAGFTVPLNEKEFSSLSEMTRTQRKKWLKDKKKSWKQKGAP